MNKISVLLLLAMLGGLARADQLAEANQAWEQQNFAKAVQIYQQLAQAGNAQAQLLLGEMVGFGEGIAEDADRAEALVKQAQASGHPEAAAMLVTLQQRRAHKADIARYVNQYDGSDVRLDCGRPAFPTVSGSRESVDQALNGMKNWATCYEQYSARLASLLPAGKVIPAEVAAVMNVAELTAARQRIDRAYTVVNAAAQAEAEQVLASNDDWLKRTKVAIAARNSSEQSLTDSRLRDLEQRNANYRTQMTGHGI